MKIVCVDDHPVMLRGLTQNIKEILPTASTHAFSGTREALDFVKDNGCDVLISEIELCGTIDGLNLARSVQKLFPRVNIIFVTVCDEREHAREVFDIKPSGYLVKPAEKDRLTYELTHLRYPTVGSDSIEYNQNRT